MARHASAVDASGARDRAVSGRTWILPVAWVTTLLISRLPEIVLREGFGLQTEWMPSALIGMVVLLWLASGVVATLSPLRPYFAVMSALTILLAVIPLILASAAWQALVPASVGEMGVLLAERVLLAILSLVVIGFLVAIGTRPADAYLRPGSTNARSGIRIPGTAYALPWSVAGPIWIVILAVLTGLAMLGIVPPVIDLPTALPLLGVAALAAALNSFWEEVAYRAAPLSQLAPVIGASPAVLLLAVWFGLGHFYGGIPSGAAGAVMAGAVGLLFGRAMIESRGLAWPWALHFTGDFVIYAVIALAATSPTA